MTAKLVVLRGPSGAGKSTIAKSLFSKAPSGTVLIEQDYYRFIFKPAGGNDNSKTIHKLIMHNVLTALDDGYHVILEGILNVRSYGRIFSAIFQEHPQHNYIFYLDVSIDETIKRHQTRQNANLFTEQDMREWYKENDLLGYDFECVISESSNPHQTLATIRQKTGL